MANILHILESYIHGRGWGNNLLKHQRACQISDILRGPIFWGHIWEISKINDKLLYLVHSITKKEAQHLVGLLRIWT
jgi:hypothetical protein